MKTLIKKIFFYDNAAKGALFGTALLIFGSWSVVNVWFILQKTLLYSALPIIALFFIYALITGCRYGCFRRKELAFSRRWKWQIPATLCWLSAAAGFVIAIMAFTGGFGFCGCYITYSIIFAAVALVTGLFCTAKIIASAEACDWKSFFGKSTFSVLIVWIFSCVALYLRSL